MSLYKEAVVNRRSSLWLGAGFLLCLVLALGGVQRAGLPQSGSSGGRVQIPNAIERLPLGFVPATRGSYQVRGAGFDFSLGTRGIDFSFAEVGRASSYELRFVRPAPTARLEARGRLPGEVNYLIGNDPARWRTRLPTYRELVYHRLWPGIDMIVRGSGGTLKYEFVVQPGAHPQNIRLEYSNVRALSLTPRGTLAVETGIGRLEDSRPAAYQVVGGKRRPVASGYRLLGGSSYGFAVAPRYRRSSPLVIDPGLEYSTLLGGSGTDAGVLLAVDAWATRTSPE